MKYLVLIPDGMADEAVDKLGYRSPMEAAYKPNMDRLASHSLFGLVQNVPEGMVPESDTANMAILSFDPKVYSKGRSPLEAVSMGLKLEGNDVAIRANTVSLSDADKYEDKIMLDNAADEITTEEIEKAQALSDNVWLSPNFEKNDKDSIQLALDAGIGVSFWTVNTVEDAKMLYDMGVRYIETDILCN